mgnify:CR=1 FL=1
MAILLTAHELKKSFASRPLFDALSFSINEGERIGLIGPNGAGKSTLLKIIAGQENTDEGNVSRRKGLRIGFLEQVPQLRMNASVLENIVDGLGKFKEPAEELPWDTVGKAYELISRLGLDQLPEGAQSPVKTLSGGWKKRVALARELARDPDLLLLDEPTNHLDVDAVLWLEEFLASARFATLTITHDRLFLQRIANRIIELDRRHAGGMLSVEGDYAMYLETRESVLAAQASREVHLRNTLRRETEWLRQGAKARTTKQKARIDRAGVLGDEVAELAFRNQQKKARIDFQSAEKQPKKLIEARDLGKTYGKNKLFEDINLILGPGTRLGLIGANGCGKSTLIRCLLGEEQPDHGTVKRADSLQVAYFQQNRDALDPQQTLVKTLAPVGEFVDYRGSRVHIRSYLDRFLFRSEQMEMPVGRLSGGEQSRVLIAKLMLEPANLLVLDEPTNDLDMDTLEVLRACLVEFTGAVILVSHDRFFLEEVCPKILAFPPAGSKHAGSLIPFEGVAQWEEWYLAEQEAAAAAAKNPGSSSATIATPAVAKIKKLSFKEQRELDTMEETIHTAETRLANLTAEASLPATATKPSRMREIAAEMKAAELEIKRLYSRWEELGS